MHRQPSSCVSRPHSLHVRPVDCYSVSFSSRALRHFRCRMSNVGAARFRLRHRRRLVPRCGAPFLRSTAPTSELSFSNGAADCRHGNRRLIDEKRFLKNSIGRRGSKRFSRLLVDISAPLRRQPHSLCDNFDPRLVYGEISTHNRTDERPTDGRTMDIGKQFRTSEIVTSDRLRRCSSCEQGHPGSLAGAAMLNPPQLKRI